MGVCSATSKCVILVINIIFWAGAAFLLYSGIRYVQSGDGVLNDVHSKPALVLFGTAALLFICGLIGIAGAFSEKKVLLGIFTFVIVATLVLLVFVSVSMFTHRDDAMNQTDTFVEKQFNNYGSPNLTLHELALDDQRTATDAPASGNVTATNTTASPTNTTAASATTLAPHTTTPAPSTGTNATTFVDEVQKNLHCCGYENFTDWDSYSFWHHHGYVPESCCNVSALTGNQTCPKNKLSVKDDVELIYTKSCKKEVDTLVKFVYDFMLWAALAFCIVVFLSLCATIFLIVRKRSSDGFNYESIVA